jgi:hypothetical protein
MAFPLLPTEEIADRYRAGWSMLDLTNEYRVGHRRIRAELDAAGVEVRPRSTQSGNPNGKAGHVRSGREAR